MTIDAIFLPCNQCTVIDQCQSNPCITGSCVSGVNQWTCVCAPGYTGLTCETGMISANQQTIELLTPVDVSSDSVRYRFKHSSLDQHYKHSSISVISVHCKLQAGWIKHTLSDSSLEKLQNRIELKSPNSRFIVSSRKWQSRVQWSFYIVSKWLTRQPVIGSQMEPLDEFPKNVNPAEQKIRLIFGTTFCCQYKTFVRFSYLIIEHFG